MLIVLSAGVMLLAFGLAGMHAERTSWLRMVQAVQTFAVFILPAFIATACWSRTPLSDLRLNRPLPLVVALLVPGLMLLAMPAINMLADWNSRVTLPECMASLEAVLKAQEEEAQRLTELFLAADNVWQLLGNVCLMALLPAFGEEVCFRGTGLNLCLNGGRSDVVPSKKAVHVSVWGIAALFSLIHFQFYGFVPRMLLGALFGYMVLWTGSIWASVLAHFTNNAVAVVAYYICAHSSLSQEAVDAFGTGDTMWAGWLSVVLTSAAIMLLWRVCQRQSSAPLP